MTTKDDGSVMVAVPRQPSTRDAPGADPLLVALARYVQALDRRYPEGPVQMRREGLDARANIPTVTPRDQGPAA